MVCFDRSGPGGGPIVEAISTDGFTAGGAVHAALLLTPERLFEWTPPLLDELTVDALGPVLDIVRPPEFLILGTGATTRFPPRPLTAALDDRGIGIEAMDSRAAARTWGLLRSEERWIVAALMPLR